MYLIPPSLPFPSLPYTHIHPIPTGIQNIIIRQKKTSPTSRHLPHPHTRQLSHAQSDPISNVRPPPSLTSPTYCQPVRNPSPTNQPKKKKKRKEEKKRGGGGNAHAARARARREHHGLQAELPPSSDEAHAARMLGGGWRG